MPGKFISYLWVSTRRQGLGLDVNRFLSPRAGNSQTDSRRAHTPRGASRILGIIVHLLAALLRSSPLRRKLNELAEFEWRDSK